MKRIFRYLVIDTFALYTADKIASGLVFDGGADTFIVAAIALTIANLFAKPVINVLLLPLNLVTFGIFRWVSSAVALYLVTLIVEGFYVNGFVFIGFSSKWIDLPSITFSSQMMSFIAFAFIISVVTSLLHRVFD